MSKLYKNVCVCVCVCVTIKPILYIHTLSFVLQYDIQVRYKIYQMKKNCNSYI